MVHLGFSISSDTKDVYSEQTDMMDRAGYNPDNNSAMDIRFRTALENPS